jgi:mycothiol system anti-sigma-R factor
MKEECRVTLERAYLFLDGEILSESERLEIKGHLEACRPCLERYGLESEVSSLLAKLRGHEGCPPRLKNRIEGLIAEEQ